MENPPRRRGNEKTTATLVFRVLLIAVALLTTLRAAQDQSKLGGRAAVPVDPIATILDAFRSHELVSVPSGHGNEQIDVFERSLIRDPRFGDTVNDVVVEFGSARYQPVIDRFVAGEEVPAASLRQIWENTAAAQPTWDSPLTEEFFRSVRAVNASLPRSRHLRVLLGDPPIDWDSVHTNEEYRPWLQRRDTFPAEVIRREVLAKHRRALIVYGQMHAQRKDLLTNFERGDGLFGLERDGTLRVFSIWAAVDADLATIQPEVVNWPRPSLAVLRGTVLGAADFTAYYPFGAPRFDITKGNGASVPRERWRSMRMEDQFDAVLYLGPPSTLTSAHLAPARCADPKYIELRVRRMAIAGLPTAEIDRLKKYCSDVAPK